MPGSVGSEGEQDETGDDWGMFDNKLKSSGLRPSGGRSAGSGRGGGKRGAGNGGGRGKRDAGSGHGGGKSGAAGGSDEHPHKFASTYCKGQKKM